MYKISCLRKLLINLNVIEIARDDTLRIYQGLMKKSHHACLSIIIFKINMRVIMILLS